MTAQHKTILIAVLLSVAAMAAVNRVPAVKEVVSADSKFLGIF
jgi:hypothetical protein